MKFLSITSNAVSPGQQSQSQHSVAQTQHNPEHVQKTDYFRGRRTDQHCTHHKPQKSKELEGEGKDKKFTNKYHHSINVKTCDVALILNQYEKRKYFKPP